MSSESLPRFWIWSLVIAMAVPPAYLMAQQTDPPRRQRSDVDAPQRPPKPDQPRTPESRTDRAGDGAESGNAAESDRTPRYSSENRGGGRPPAMGPDEFYEVPPVRRDGRPLPPPNPPRVRGPEGSPPPHRDAVTRLEVRHHEDMEAVSLAQRYRRSRDEEEKERLADEIRELTRRTFEKRMEQRRDQMAKLRQELDEIGERLDRREAMKEQVIQRRLAELLDTPDPLDWDMEPLPNLERNATGRVHVSDDPFGRQPAQFRGQPDPFGAQHDPFGPHPGPPSGRPSDSRFNYPRPVHRPVSEFGPGPGPPRDDSAGLRRVREQAVESTEAVESTRATGSTWATE